MEIELNSKLYMGSKITFNSRKGTGTIVRGIAVQIVPELDVVILRDAENFPHAVYKHSVKEISK